MDVNNEGYNSDLSCLHSHNINIQLTGPSYLETHSFLPSPLTKL